MKRISWAAIAVAVGIVSFSALSSFSPPARAGSTWVVDADGQGSASDCDSTDTAYSTIQEAIDAAAADDTISVCPGTYDEDEANDRDPDNGGAGSNDFNIFVDKAVTIQGVDALGTPIDDYADVAAYVEAKRKLPTFGESTIFVQADGVTITGLDVTGWLDDDYNNKTLEVVGDDFTLRDCALHALDTASALYFDDRHFNAGTMTSHVQSYRVEENLLDGGGPDADGIRISSGAGWSGPVSGRVIADNTFDNTIDGIAFVGPGGDPWDVYPVGAATITGNDFSRSDRRHVVAWGSYLGGPGYGDIDWDGIVAHNDNHFDKAAITWTPLGDARPWSAGSFIDVRGIYSAIQKYAVNKAVAGDTVQVLPGTYNEQVIINKPLTVNGAGQGVTVIAPSPIAVNTTRVGGSSPGSAVAGIVVVDTTTDVTIRDLTVDGAGNALTVCDPPALFGVYWRNASGTIEDSEVQNIEWGSGHEGCQGAIGIFAESGGTGSTTVTIDGNSVHDVQKNGISANGAATTATISGNTVVGWGPTDKIAQNGIQIGFGAGGSITGNEASGYDYTPSTWAAAGILVTQAKDGVVVSGNNVHNNMEGLFIVNYSTPTMKNLTVSGNTVANTRDTGVYLLLVDNSEVSGNSISSGSVGLWLADSSSIAAKLNTISGNGDGIVIDGDSRNDTFTSNDILNNAATGVTVMPFYAEPSGLVFRFNSIAGNGTYGIDNTTSKVVDATGNWWDSDSGPTHTLNPGGTGDAVGDNVAFSPWLGIGTDSSGDIGFQPASPMTFIVEPQVCLPVGCIQQGVNLASDGDTIQVKAGTYNEQVVIDTPNLTLNGPNAGVDPGCTGTRPTAEATIAWSTLTTVGTASTVVIAANGVTVDGFTIQNTNGTQNQVSVLIGGHYVGDSHPSDGSNVRNNIISSGYNNVYVWQSSDSTIERNRVSASVETQISIRDSATQGSRDALRNSVLNNCIDKAGVTSLGHSVAIGVTPVGSAAQDFTGTLIQGNTMKNSGAGTGHYRGIDAYFANGTTAEPVRIYGNTITDTSEQGIRIESSNNYDVGGGSASTGNTITGSRGAVGGYRRGIATAGTSTGLSIQYNTISGHSSTSGNDGEIVVTTSGNTILHNTLYVADSSPTGVGGIGLRLDTPSSNVFGENTFQGNGQRMLQASGAPGPGLTVVDVTASTFKTATGTTLDPNSLVDLVSIEDRVRHHMDVPSNLVLLVFKTDTTVATALNNASTPGAVQRAINAVPGSSSTVVVGPGTYNENVSINKALILQGSSKPVIDGGATGDVISVSANGVTIDGFEIRNGYNGIMLASASNTVISDNEIHHNVNVPGSAGAGILFWGNNDNNQIINNVIHDNDRQGLFIGDCDFAGPDWACTVGGTAISTGNTMSGNTIYNNGLNETGPPDASRYGIQLWNADNNTIEKNEVYGHTKTPGWWFAVGIYLCGATNTAVQTNVLHDNEYNIGIYDCGGSSAGTSITGNSIMGAGNTGIRVWSDAATTVARLNIISGNAIYGVRNTDTTGDVDARGNWWGDVTGPYHPTKNPGGLGDYVSDYVLFDAVPDNCPTVYNPDQLNTDAARRPNGSQIPGEWASNPNQDTLGDACDTDDDNDWMLDTGTHPVTGVPGEDVGCGSGPTNPLVADTDGDTVIDGAECALGSDPNDPTSKPALASPDKDGDGLPAWLDNLLCPSDVDGDGLVGDNDLDCDSPKGVVEFTDGREFNNRGTAPSVVDTDGDSCKDWIEIVDLDGNRVSNINDVYIVASRAFPPTADPVEKALCDLDGNGTVNINDVYLAAQNSQLLKAHSPCGPEG